MNLSQIVTSIGLGSIIFNFTLPLPANAELSQWTLGIEREHSPGSYSTHWGSIEGWQLWSIELDDGRVCDAIKTASGVQQPVPVYKGIYEESQTFLSLKQIEDLPLLLSLISTDGDPSLAKEYRISGERFFRDYDVKSTNWTDFDGQTLEVHLAGRGRGNAGSEWFDETIAFDMTGVSRAKAWVQACMRDPTAP